MEDLDVVEFEDALDLYSTEGKQLEKRDRRRIAPVRGAKEEVPQGAAPPPALNLTTVTGKGKYTCIYMYVCIVTVTK